MLEGQQKKYKGTLGTAVIKAFDPGSSLRGLNEKQLRAAGVPYTHDNARWLARFRATPERWKRTKLILSEEVGAQAVGADGAVDIDVVATAIHAGMSVDDLADLELAYAPPFSSAKIRSISLVTWPAMCCVANSASSAGMSYKRYNPAACN